MTFYTTLNGYLPLPCLFIREYTIHCRNLFEFVSLASSSESSRRARSSNRMLPYNAGCYQHIEAAVLGKNHNELIFIVLAYDKMTWRESNKTINKLVFFCIRTSTWQEHTKIIDVDYRIRCHTASKGPAKSSETYTLQCLGQSYFFPKLSNIHWDKKKPYNSFYLFSSNYLITL